MLAMTSETVDLHLESLAEDGGVIYDERLPIDPGVVQASGRNAFPLPLSTIAQQTGGSRGMTNTALLGAAAGVAGFPTESMEQVLRENFASKGDVIVERNLAVLRAAHQAAQATSAGDFGYQLAPRSGAEPQLLVQGNQALAFGAIAAGCRFISAYPMTPGTSILEWLTDQRGRGALDWGPRGHDPPAALGRAFLERGRQRPDDGAPAPS